MYVLDRSLTNSSFVEIEVPSVARKTLDVDKNSHWIPFETAVYPSLTIAFDRRGQFDTRQSTVFSYRFEYKVNSAQIIVTFKF